MADNVTFTPGGVPAGARLSRFASTRLLHEWAQMQPWSVAPVYELRLGPTPLSASAGAVTPEIEAMLRNFNRYADLIGITDTEIQVVEAKMQFDPGAISQVLHYVALVHTTPILKSYPQARIVPVILIAFDDAVLRQVAEAQGIRVILYTPAWASDWLNRRYSKTKALLPVEE